MKNCNITCSNKQIIREYVENGSFLSNFSTNLFLPKFKFTTAHLVVSTAQSPIVACLKKPWLKAKCITSRIWQNVIGDNLLGVSILKDQTAYLHKLFSTSDLYRSGSPRMIARKISLTWCNWNMFISLYWSQRWYDKCFKMTWYFCYSFTAISLLPQNFSDGTMDYTLFAPTDRAFKASKISLRSTQCLKAIARNHIVKDVFCSPALQGIYYVSNDFLGPKL